MIRFLSIITCFCLTVFLFSQNESKASVQSRPIIPVSAKLTADVKKYLSNSKNIRGIVAFYELGQIKAHDFFKQCIDQQGPKKCYDMIEKYKGKEEANECLDSLQDKNDSCEFLDRVGLFLAFKYLYNTNLKSAVMLDDTIFF